MILFTSPSPLVRNLRAELRTIGVRVGRRRRRLRLGECVCVVIIKEIRENARSLSLPVTLTKGKVAAYFFQQVKNLAIERKLRTRQRERVFRLKRGRKPHALAPSSVIFISSGILIVNPFFSLEILAKNLTFFPVNCSYFYSHKLFIKLFLYVPIYPSKMF